MSDGEVEFIVPDVFWAELGNVLWKGARSRKMDPAMKPNEVSTELQSRDFVTVPRSPFFPDALRIAFMYDRAVYDCLYTAFAVASKADLITADERLANALAAHFPVTWLGASLSFTRSLQS